MISRGSIVVMAIGGALLIISIVHHSQEWMRVASRLGPIISVILDGGLAISLISAGWWLRKQQTTLSPDETWAIALWTGCGAVIGAGITSVIFGVLSLEGRPLSEPIFVFLVATGSGGVVMFIAGYQATLQRATRQRYDTLVNDAEQFIGLLQLDGTVIEINDTALTFGGIERSDVIGRKFDDISWWTHSESVHERVQSALERAADGEFVRYETNVRGVDGLRRIRFSAKPIADNTGNVKQILVEGTDMSDQHRQQQHLQVLYRIFRHDMRNDVMKIRGWTHEAATAATREERVESSERVDKILASWDEMFFDLQEIQDAISVDADGDER
ncbi:MAG: PAS sensor histidine kinase [Haloquadratum walsbyi J07HQW2]|uniref:PAS sensor histidine kinase n=2 Tax=Haloquadratum walsbyi TaxID=293091 RepID=U1NBJ6_9EURY|nr:MAG: PAS sensor histidine kinase [Haloquadratum walsbyi J07HQW2]